MSACLRVLLTLQPRDWEHGRGHEGISQYHSGHSLEKSRGVGVCQQGNMVQPSQSDFLSMLRFAFMKTLDILYYNDYEVRSGRKSIRSSSFSFRAGAGRPTCPNGYEGSNRRPEQS